jgi:hypothetical protein
MIGGPDRDRTDDLFHGWESTSIAFTLRTLRVHTLFSERVIYILLRTSEQTASAKD